MSDARPVEDGGTLTVAFKSDPDELDPSLGSTLVGRSVFAAMCQKLYGTDAENRIEPQLAYVMPKLSDGGRKVVIGVRRGARFSDGTPLDAKAAETSLKRHRDLPASARASELEPVESIEAVGDHTVELRLKEPYEPLLGALADRSGMVMSPRALKKYGEDFATHPSCVGPFRFKERVTGDRIVLEKDPHYYAASRVHLKRVVYRTIIDGNVRLANLRSGDAQISDQAAPLEVQSALTDDELRIFNSPTLGYQGLTVDIGNTRGLGKKPGKVAAVEFLADRIAVMYLGEIIEVAPAADLFAAPKHPCTQALLSAVPVPDPPVQRARQRIVLKGDLTGPAFPRAAGTAQTVDHCRFHTRCPLAVERCRTQAPEHRTLPGPDGGRMVACHLVADDGTAPDAAATAHSGA